MKDPMQNKDSSIETLRGIAIILVVMTHVIGTGGNGLEAPEGSLLHWLYQLTNNYRMPLFAVIAGYVYALRPIRAGATGAFVGGKLRRLLVPLVSVSTLHFLVVWLTPAAHSRPVLADIWKIYVFSYDQFWFLQAMVLIFLALPVFERFGLLDTFGKWAISLAAAYGIPSLVRISCTVFSIDGFAYLLSCFILGIGLYRFRSHFGRPRVLILSGILFLCTVCIQQLSYFGICPIPFDRTRGLGLGFGLIGAVFFFAIRRPVPGLAWMGTFAFDIYLFHRFGQAGSRILLQSAGINNVAILFVTGVVAGLTLPVVASRLLARSVLARHFLLGRK